MEGLVIEKRKSDDFDTLPAEDDKHEEPLVKEKQNIFLRVKLKKDNKDKHSPTSPYNRSDRECVS